METITVSLPIVDGHFKVDLGKACNCEVGLVEITLPPQGDNGPIGQFDIQCMEIDRTYTNPDRLLRRIFIKRTRGEYYRTIEFQHIIYKKIDSSDRYLNFLFYDDQGKLLVSPYNGDEDKVTFVLSFIPKSDKTNFNI